MKRQKFVISIVMTVMCLCVLEVSPRPTIASPQRQEIPTATPVLVSLPTQLPLLPTATSIIGSSPSIERSPTPAGAAYLEAITEANVRSQPDPESERLGTIRTGEQYVVIGQYFRWYQFQYNQSASGTGWVFDELVNVNGNVEAITDLTVSTPTPVESGEQLIGTLALITQTPGGILTATADVGNVPLPMVNNSNDNSFANQLDLIATPLPTFTVPPNIDLSKSSQQLPNGTATLGTIEPPRLPFEEIGLPSRVPPLLPILVLGGAGILGLLISSARR